MKWSLFVKENSQTDKEKAIEIIKDFINAKNVLFHGGKLIEKLEDREDLFGTGLFFSANHYSMTMTGETIFYVINKDNYNIVRLKSLSYKVDYNEPELEKYAKRWNISIEDAFEIVIEDNQDLIYELQSEKGWDGEDTANISWSAQGTGLKIALNHGYDGVEGLDEQGTYYLMGMKNIDMAMQDSNRAGKYQVMLKGKPVYFTEEELEEYGIDLPIIDF